MTYNGWPNYETWAVALWMDNEEGSYNYVRELVREMVAEMSDYPRADIADRLKEEYEEAMPELEGVWSDLLGAAFSEVNWWHIADNLLSDALPTDKEARRIAAQYHGGITAALYKFASTGAIVADLADEITEAWSETDEEELCGLHAYVVTAGERGPVDGWAS